MFPKVVSFAALASLMASAALAQVAPTTIRVADQTVPPGGGGQLQLLMTSPRPVMTGKFMMNFAMGSYDSIDGIALFSPTGDVSGAAVVNGNVISARFTSPQGTFGTNPDYPILTIAYKVPATAVPGSTMPLHIEPGTTLTDLFGPIALELRDGTLTVGGNVSVTNVVPGGGTLPAGTVVSLRGTGFTSRTKVVLKEVKTDTQFVSPNEIRIILRQTVKMDGQMIKVDNPDHNDATYFSYLRGVPMGSSSVQLFAATVPLFSTQTLDRAVLIPSNMPLVSSDYITGIALQNPNLKPVDVDIEQFDSASQRVARTTLTMPAGSRIVRESSELLGVAQQSGHYFSVKANAPIQLLGLVGQNSAGEVQSINASPAP